MSAPTATPLQTQPTPEPAVTLSPSPVGGFAMFATPVTPTTRLMSLDAYRGFIMLFMASGGLAIPGVVKAMCPTQEALDAHPVWRFLAFHTDHVPWEGGSLWDMIQPAFMFMVGVALPYSFASRQAKGQSPLKIYLHAALRSFILIVLGVFLASNWSRQTDFVFTNVLAQIGLGYFFLCFLVNRGRLVQSAALAAILVGYGLWFYVYPSPGEDFNYLDAGVAELQPWSEGAFAHWDKNTNAAAAFDRWFLNQFPQPVRVSPTLSVQMGLLAPPPAGPWAALPYAQFTPRIERSYFFSSGGYQTLNFIPSLATMILGLMAGELLRSMAYTDIEKFIRLAFAGFVLVVAGMILGALVCPPVKRIWTPTWVLYSGGWVFLMLAAFYLVIDIWGFQRWVWPLVVVGMNSIAMYMMAQLIKGWTATTLRTHLGQDFFSHWFTRDFAPIAQSAAVLLVLWLMCVWLYRQKIFVRI
jgi:predicted acyltransferase